MDTTAGTNEGIWTQIGTLFVGTPVRFHTGDEFRLFPTRFERHGLRFVWLFALVTSFCFWIVSPWINKTAPDVFAVKSFPGTVYYLTQAAFAVACLLVAHWSHCIPGAFRVLLENAERPISREEQRAFLQSYSEMLRSNGRYLLIAFYLLGSTAFLISVDWMMSVPPQPLLSSRSLVIWTAYVVWFPGFVLLGAYLTGACAWAMIVTAIFTNRTAEIHGVRIWADHSDGCGGLEPLSQFCLASALPLIASGLFLAIVGSHLLDLGFRNPAIEEHVRTVARTTFVWNALVSIVVFVVPIWRVHLQMLEKRRVQQDKIASRLERLTAKMERCLEGEDLPGATTAKEWLTVLEAAYSHQEWPTWPISREIRLKFVGGQVFSAIPIAVNAFSAIRKLL